MKQHPALALRQSLVSSLVLCCCCIALSGCSADFSKSATSPSQGFALSGSVHGGQQAVSGSQVYLYAAGVGGYGTAARSMLTGSGYVSTGTAGDFSITGDYTCQPGDQVYLLAKGGNPGLPAGTVNAALALMAALGPCSALLPSTRITINEATTVAAAYALAGFMSSPTQLSSSGSTLAITGVANAFRNAGSLASSTTGLVNVTTPNGSASIPKAEIDSLANVVASCINSNGTGTACSALFTAATPAGGVAPADTVQAALNIAHNPGLNVSSLYNLSTAYAPFQPSLSAAPHDWSVAITYTGPSAGYNSSNGIAFDSAGNLWSSNQQSISIFDTTGALLSPSGGFGTGAADAYVGALAIDPSGRAWVAHYNYSGSGDATNFGIQVMNSAGVTLSPAGGYTGGGLSTFYADSIAFDTSGNLWSFGDLHQNFGFSILNGTTGAAISPASGYLVAANTFVSAPSVLADNTGHMWASTYRLASDGTTLTSTSPCGNAFNDVSAIDAGGNLWGGNGDGLEECNASGSLLTPNGYSANMGSADVQSVAVDGANRIWYFNGNGSGIIGAITSSGAPVSPAGGYQMEQDTGAAANYMAIDGSGNIWLADDGPYLVEFIGIASPVVTPFATAVAHNQLGARP